MKEQYLEELKKELEEKGVSNKDAIVEKYQKRYDFGIEAGLSDNEIIEMLGNPKDIASRYQKIEDIAEEEGKENAGYNLSIRTAVDDINIYYRDIDKVHLYFDGINLADYQVENNTKTGILINRRGSEGGLRVLKNGGKITVEIPLNRVFDKVSIWTASGDHNIEKLKAKSISISAVSGDFDGDYFEAENISFSTVSGDIDVKKIKASKLNLNTVSGDVDIDEVDAPKVNVTTVSGDINIKKCDGNVNAAVVSGDVVVNNKRYNRLDRIF